MTKTLLLINPGQQIKPNLAATLRLPQTGLGYLAALTPPGWDIRIIDENIDPLIIDGADLVGITAYTCTAPRAYEIAGLFRKQGVTTVMGGVHASMLPQEAGEYVDAVVVGEAESVWPMLIRDFEKRELKKLYRAERASLEGMVRPRRDLFSRRHRLPSVETSRGCPHNCEFCSVTAFNGHTYRQRATKDVLDELESLEGKYFFFSDDNILGYGKKAEARAIELFRGMAERGLKKRWGAYVDIDFAANSEVLEYARKAGCLGVFIGFESVNEESLQTMHKVRNLKTGVGNYTEVIKKVHDKGIGVVGAFVLGSDGDQKDVFDRTTEFIVNSGVDAVQLSILNPFPGTRLYTRLQEEGRLLRTNYPSDWSRYDFSEALFIPRNMTPDELTEGVTRMYKHITSRAVSLKRAFRSARETRNLPGALIAYIGNRAAGAIWMNRHNNHRPGDRAV